MSKQDTVIVYSLIGFGFTSACFIAIWMTKSQCDFNLLISAALFAAITLQAIGDAT